MPDSGPCFTCAHAEKQVPFIDGMVESLDDVGKKCSSIPCRLPLHVSLEPVPLAADLRSHLGSNNRCDRSAAMMTPEDNRPLLVSFESQWLAIRASDHRHTRCIYRYNVYTMHMITDMHIHVFNLARYKVSYIVYVPVWIHLPIFFRGCLCFRHSAAERGEAMCEALPVVQGTPIGGAAVRWVLWLI